MGTGAWSSSYTFRTLLLQIQNFVSDPDAPEYCWPSKEKIENLKNSLIKNYTNEI